MCGVFKNWEFCILFLIAYLSRIYLILMSFCKACGIVLECE